MPPKKRADKKVPIQIVRPSLSASSLVVVPDDALPDFEERIHTDIPWNACELGFRHHAAQCHKEDLATIRFSQALQQKLDSSIVGNMLRDDSLLTLEEQFELLPLETWDNDKFGTEEAKICFENRNNVTDNLIQMIEEAVKKGGRRMLKKRLKSLNTLRLVYCKMTELDKDVSKLSELHLLNLCGNYLRSPSATLLPPQLRALELQANRIAELRCLERLPAQLVYLGLARNFLTNDCGFEALKFSSVVVLDLSDNDIYDVEPTAEALSELRCLSSLSMAGNPCSVCAAYAACVLARLPRLLWLDGRAPLATDRPEHHERDEPHAPLHPDDLRSAYFVFTCYRVMALLQPTKAEKGCVMAFHVELELPLLDSRRRQFLMHRRAESLTEMLPEPEDAPTSTSSRVPSRGKISRKGTSEAIINDTKLTIKERKQSRSQESQDEEAYAKLTAKSSREVVHYTVFRSNSVPWARVISFQKPTVRIFCPDLVALRDTFRTEVTVRLVLTMGRSGGQGTAAKSAGELRCVVASVLCDLRAPNWSQRMQDFHWDDSMPTDRAVHWGDGDLSVLQYNQLNERKPAKKTKLGADAEATNPLCQAVPNHLTCHFGFGVERRMPKSVSVCVILVSQYIIL